MKKRAVKKPSRMPIKVADTPKPKYFAKISRLKKPSALVVPIKALCSSTILPTVAKITSAPTATKKSEKVDFSLPKLPLPTMSCTKLAFPLTP